MRTPGHQLSALEREVGQELRERAGRGVRPTAAEFVLAEHSDRTLDAIGDAEAALDDIRHGSWGRLRVG